MAGTLYTIRRPDGSEFTTPNADEVARQAELYGDVSVSTRSVATEADDD